MVAIRHDVDSDLRAQVFAIGRQGEVAKGGANGAHAIRARQRSVGVKNTKANAEKKIICFEETSIVSFR